MPPTPASIGSLSAVLKTVYDKQAEVIAFDSHPFLGRVPKNDKFGGENHVQTVRFVGGQGVSTKFTSALNNRTPNSYRKFVITRFSRYGIGSITGESILAAKGDLYTMANGLESEIEGLFTTIGIQSAADLYRSGSGTIGRGNGGALTTTFVVNDTLTLAVPSDAIHFGVGGTYETSPTDGAGPANVGNVNLVAVDMLAGKLVASVAWNVAIAGFATTDYIAPEGNYSLVGTNQTCMPGLAAWIPAVAPGPTDSLFGVNRSVAPVELAGQRINGNGDPREETWQNAMALCARFGAKITDGYMHPNDLAKLTISLGSQVRREEKATNTNVGYQSVEVSGPTGTVKIFGDPDCPEGIAYGVKLSDWELMSLGKMPMFLMLDGNRILREASADAYEYRIGYYAALRCKVPKNQISITWLGAAMSSQTRWPSQAATNEMVEVPMSWDFAGAADLVRTPMVVDGQDQSASIQGTAVRAILRAGVGTFTVNLKQSWPWFLGDSLKVSTDSADPAAPYTTKLTTDLTYQDPTTPVMTLYVFDATGVLADPPAGHTLIGSINFRNRRVGS